MNRSAVALFLALIACSAPQARDPGAAEENKTVVRRFYDAYNRGDWEALRETVHSGYTHRTPSEEMGIEAFQQAAASVRRGMPDWRLTIDDIVAEGDQVAVRLTGRGSHRGSFAGERPTGQAVVAHGVIFHRLEDGRIVEDWELSDMHPSIQELQAAGGPGAVAAHGTPCEGPGPLTRRDSAAGTARPASWSRSAARPSSGGNL